MPTCLPLRVIGGSFQHKQIHKATRVSPDLMTEYQIDHVHIGKKFRRSLDHHLLKLTKNERQGNPVSGRGTEEFRTTLSKKVQILQQQTERETMDEH